MKYLLVLALGLTSAMLVMGKSCSSGDDCERDECCANYLVVSRCQKRKLEGQSCSIDKYDEPPKKYRFSCPCQTDLDCINQKVIKIFGTEVEYDSRCQKKEPVTEEPETEAPETEEPETEAPETEAPETEAPETEEPETEAPETEAPDAETEAPEPEPEPEAEE